MTSAIAIQAELTEIEELLLTAAEKSHPQPLTARIAQNYSRRLKAASLPDIRAAMLSLSQTHENVHTEGEGNAIALVLDGLLDIEPVEPEPQDGLEWTRWKLRRAEDREELEDWAATSRPVQTPWGTVSVGDWVLRADKLDQDRRPMQVIGIENATKVALVSFFGIPNTLDSIPCSKLYFCSDIPQPQKSYTYPKPYDETFRILEAPQVIKPVVTPQTKLDSAKIELEKAQQKYKMAEDNYYSAQIKHDAFFNQSAPNQNELNINEFLQLRSKIESQAEGYKKLLSNASQSLEEARDDLDDSVKLVGKLTAEIERNSAISTAEIEFQAAYTNYCDALKKLYKLKAFHFRELGTFDHIPNFKDGKIQCDRLATILN